MQTARPAHNTPGFKNLVTQGMKEEQVTSTVGPCSSREQRCGLLVLVLVLLQEGHPQQGTCRSPCHQHSSESTIKHLETLPTACIQRNAQTAHCPHQSNFSDLRSGVPFQPKHEAMCMLRPPLPNFTDPNLCCCLAASPEMKPSSQLASNPFCSPISLLLHGPKCLPHPACSARSHPRSPDPGDNTSLSRQECLS